MLSRQFYVQQFNDEMQRKKTNSLCIKLLCAHAYKNKQKRVTQMTVLNHQHLTQVSINSVSVPPQVR